VLERQQRGEVAFQAETDRRTDDHAHGQCERIPGTARALEDPFAQELCEPSVQRLIADFMQESRGEEEKAFGRLVISRSVQVSPVLEHSKHPFERIGQLVPAPHGVEEGKDVETDYRVGTWPFGVEISLPEMV
jgi:hypothetical protein